MIYNKIVQLFVPGPTGGVEKVLLQGTKALLELGINIPIWVIRETRVPDCANNFLHDAEELGIKIRVFDCHSKFDLNLNRSLKQALVQESVSLIHAHGIKAIFYTILLKNKNLKIISTHHGTTSHTLKVRMYEIIELLGLKLSDQVIAVSNPMKLQLLKKGICRDKIEVIENLLSFPIKLREVPPNNILKLVFIGRLSSEKGCHLLIQALNKIGQSLAWDLTIVGDGEQASYLKNLTKELELKNRINFLGFQKDVRPFLSEKDCLIMPSLREGLPLTLIEACCAGLPVIASNVGGIPDLITSNYNGILTIPGNIQSLEEAIRKFNENKNNLIVNAMTEAPKFQKRFASNSWANKTAIVYTRLLSQE